MAAGYSEEKLAALVGETLAEVLLEKTGALMAPVGVSARHVHLSAAHVAALFGTGHTLTPVKDLSQPGQFACAQTVDLIGPKGTIAKVRVLGPERAQTQVEISASDARRLGVNAPVRSSGMLAGTPGITLCGPDGQVVLAMGVVVADRHLHISPEQAAAANLVDGETVCAPVPGPKGGVMGGITVRVNPAYRLDLHVDTDDANAFALAQGQRLPVQKAPAGEVG